MTEKKKVKVVKAKVEPKVKENIIVNVEALLKQAYSYGKEYGLTVGESEGVKFIAQTAERFMEEHKAQRPTWWIATLVQCLKPKYPKVVEEKEGE